MATMEMTTARADGVLVVQVIGSVDAAQAPDLQARLTALVEGGERALVVDLAALEYISSAGLRVFAHLARAVGQARGKLGLAAPQVFVKDVFVLAGFDELMDFYDTVAAATRAVQ